MTYLHNETKTFNEASLTVKKSFGLQLAAAAGLWAKRIYPIRKDGNLLLCSSDIIEPVSPCPWRRPVQQGHLKRRKHTSSNDHQCIV